VDTGSERIEANLPMGSLYHKQFWWTKAANVTEANLPVEFFNSQKVSGGLSQRQDLKRCAVIG